MNQFIQEKLNICVKNLIGLKLSEQTIFFNR
jgi:hypothetical protein